jgi:hypothetical protein
MLIAARDLLALRAKLPPICGLNWLNFIWTARFVLDSKSKFKAESSHPLEDG